MKKVACQVGSCCESFTFHLVMRKYGKENKCRPQAFSFSEPRKTQILHTVKPSTPIWLDLDVYFLFFFFFFLILFFCFETKTTWSKEFQIFFPLFFFSHLNNQTKFIKTYLNRNNEARWWKKGWWWMRVYWVIQKQRSTMVIPQVNHPSSNFPYYPLGWKK